MVALPQQYNTADLPDTGGKTVLIPQGQYTGLIVKSEMKPTKNGQGQYLELTIVVTQGDYKNTEFIERLNIVNNSSQAVEIAYKTLARISEAVGMVQTPADSSELHNKPLMFEVKTEAGKPWTDNDGNERDGVDKSVIAKYLPSPSVGTGGTAAPSGGAPAAVQQSVAQQSAPAQATPPAGGNPFAA